MWSRSSQMQIYLRFHSKKRNRWCWVWELRRADSRERGSRDLFIGLPELLFPSVVPGTQRASSTRCQQGVCLWWTHFPACYIPLGEFPVTTQQSRQGIPYSNLKVSEKGLGPANGTVGKEAGSCMAYCVVWILDQWLDKQARHVCVHVSNPKGKRNGEETVTWLSATRRRFLTHTNTHSVSARNLWQKKKILLCF